VRPRLGARDEPLKNPDGRADDYGVAGRRRCVTLCNHEGEVHRRLYPAAGKAATERGSSASRLLTCRVTKRTISS
jgi:hypothetical protein